MREKTAILRRLDCCGEVVQLCEEECIDRLNRFCRGMTVKEYVDKYERIHRLVCKQQYEM